MMSAVIFLLKILSMLAGSLLLLWVGQFVGTKLFGAIDECVKKELGNNE